MKQRNQTTSTLNKIIIVFQKTRRSNDDVIDDDDDATMSKLFCKSLIMKIFRKLTRFDDDFDEMTTTKRCFENFLTMFDSKSIFNRFNNVMIFLTTFSYFRTKSMTSSSFDKFFQTLYSSSYFFHRIKYSCFFFLIWRLLINRSISKNLILTMFFSTNTKFEWLNLSLRKKWSKKTKHDFNWTILKTKCIRQWFKIIKR